MAVDAREPLTQRLIAPLMRMGEKPWCFLMVLLALRAAFRPYAGITHDAKLYALQVLNRASPGLFGQDLFFLYGSQDNYSVFSLLVAPLAAVLGLQWSLMLVYWASMALVLLAEIRVVRCLIADRRIANVALVLLAVTDVTYAGHGIFHVHEAFLTARLPAVALTLLGLEQLLRGRHLRATLWMLAAMAFHPLMAVSGLTVAVGAWAWDRLSGKTLLWIAAAGVVAGLAVLAYRPWGTALLGLVDPAWCDILRRRNPHLFPSHWELADWWRIAMSGVILLVGAGYSDHRVRRVLWLVGLVGLAGTVGAALAEGQPYALLLQGQAFRVLWLVQLLAVPLGALLTVRLWQEGTFLVRGGSVLVLCFTGRLIDQGAFAPESSGPGLLLLAGVTVVAALLFRSRPNRSAATDWLWPGVVVGLGIYALVRSIGGVFSFGHLAAARVEDPIRLLWLIPRECSDAVVAGAAVLVVAGLWRLAGNVRRAGLVAVALWIGLGLATFLVRNDAWYQDQFVRDHADLAFVRQFVQDHRSAGGAIPVVYWPTDAVHVWFGLPARSFYSWEQTVGSLFNRRTAFEGLRRLLLVRPFEIARIRETGILNRDGTRLLAVCRSDLNEPAPTREDLIALCREKTLDYVVLRQPFEDLAVATNGHVFIFDCRSIRARQSADSTVAAGSAAPLPGGSVHAATGG